MRTRAAVVASFPVSASTAGKAYVDLGELETAIEQGPEALLAFVESVVEVDLSLCHACGNQISDPEAGDVAGFTVFRPDGSETVYSSAGTVWATRPARSR